VSVSALVLLSGCLVAFVAAMVLTALARRYALSRRLVDAPGERRSHVVATPRGGGIAIVAVTLPVMSWLAAGGQASSPVFLMGALGLALVAGVGWIDDHRSLSPWSRLGIHMLAAGLLATAVAWIGQPAWWAIVIFLMALGLVNVWNFMDGIDGIASSQAVLVAAGCLLTGMRGEGAVLAWVLAAACLGFLPFNFPKARIFLGDVGSGALGYLLACLLALGPEPDPVVSLALLLPLSAFLIDATLTLLSRIMRRERWWMPHVQHLYQRCIQAGHAHAVVTLGYAAWTLLSILVAVRVAGAPPPVIIGAVVTWYLLGSTLWLLLRSRQVRRAKSS